jgi:hypothetical protein
MGVGYTHSSTRIVWDGTADGDLVREAAFVTTEKRFSRKFAMQLGAGATLGGALESAVYRHRLGPGWAGFLSFTAIVLDGTGAKPLLLATATVSISSTRTVDRTSPNVASTLAAADFRGGLVLGKTFFDRVTPYVVGRIFGGPVHWQIAGRDQVGTDAYHVQLGLGGVVTIAPFDVYLEGVPVGERSLGGGVGVSF